MARKLVRIAELVIVKKTILRELVELATAHGFFSSAFGDYLLGFLLDI